MIGGPQVFRLETFAPRQFFTPELYPCGRNRGHPRGLTFRYSGGCDFVFVHQLLADPFQNILGANQAQTLELACVKAPFLDELQGLFAKAGTPFFGLRGRQGFGGGPYFLILLLASATLEVRLVNKAYS